MAKLAQFVPSWDTGGRAQLVASFAAANPLTPTFSSPPDRGNLDIGNCSYSSNVFTFRVRWDNAANSTGGRFLFAQLDGVLGLTPSFQLVRTNLGLTMADTAKFVYSYDGVVWAQMQNRGSDATYYTFSHNAPFAANRVYVALWPAWQTGRTLPWIQSLAGSGYVSDTTSSTGYIFETRTATVNEQGGAITSTPLHAFKVSTSGAAPDGSPKRNMVLMSGVHASEDVGNYALKGAVEFLVSEDAQAQLLRSWFDVYVYPLVASAGRKGGGTRSDFQSGFMTTDVNRQWLTSNFETLTKHKTAILADTGGTCEVFMDFHGTVTTTTRYDYYEPGSDNTAWTTAIRTYIPSLPVNLQDDNGVSSEWVAASLGAPPINLIPESVTVSGDTTQVYVEQYGADHMRAVALMASQEYFGSTLSVDGVLSARETGLDTAVIVGSGQFYSVGDIAATELGLDTAVITGALYAAAQPGRLTLTGRVPTVTQSAFLGSSSEWNVVVDDEITTFTAD